jgi:hypothetical protein
MLTQKPVCPLTELGFREQQLNWGLLGRFHHEPDQRPSLRNPDEVNSEAGEKDLNHSL